MSCEIKTAVIENSTLKTIPEWLSVIANDRTEAPAILGIERPPLTYQMLQSQINTIGSQLNNIEIKPGDAVAIALDNGAEFLVSILGVASAATAFPLNPNQPQDEFERYFRLIDIKAVIVAQYSQSAIVTVAKQADIPILEVFVQPFSPAGQFELLSNTEPTKKQPHLTPTLDD